MIARIVMGRGKRRQTFEGVNGKNDRMREEVKNLITRPELFKALHAAT